jgi:hypothetical protein
MENLATSQDWTGRRLRSIDRFCAAPIHFGVYDLMRTGVLPSVKADIGTAVAAVLTTHAATSFSSSHLCAPSYCDRYRPAARQGHTFPTIWGLVSSIAWPSSDCLIILLLPGSGRGRLAVDQDYPPNASFLSTRLLL